MKFLVFLFSLAAFSACQKAEIIEIETCELTDHFKKINGHYYLDGKGIRVVNTSSTKKLEVTVKETSVEEGKTFPKTNTRIFKLNPGEESTCGCSEQRKDGQAIAKFSYNVVGELVVNE